MGDPEKDLPLDLASSPWRRWSPIALDVGVVFIGLNIIHALLIIFYPYGVMVGWIGDADPSIAPHLQRPALGMEMVFDGRSLGGWAAILFLLRVVFGLAGWHRLAFCAVFPVAGISAYAVSWISAF
jgi:hypothetical protein